jgi:hypothetical protein
MLVERAYVERCGLLQPAWLSEFTGIATETACGWEVPHDLFWKLAEAHGLARRPTPRLRLADIERQAPHRPLGYLETVLSAGQIVGDWVEFDVDTFERLRERYGSAVEPPAKGCSNCGD